jgi:hypothetical protein
MNPLETFFWGFLGSAAVELMTLVGLYSSRRGRLPGRYRKVGFWFTRVGLALVAGALAAAYEIDQRILAFNVGAATPLIVTFMAKGLRQVPRGRGCGSGASHRSENFRIDGTPARADGVPPAPISLKPSARTRATIIGRRLLQPAVRRNR